MSERRVDYHTIDALLDAQAKRDDLTPLDVLHLTIARRLNGASDKTFAEALGGGDVPPLNFWGKR